MRRVKSLALVLASLLPCGAYPGAQQCSVLQDTKPNALVSYLHSVVPNDANADCVTVVIRTLGEQRYQPAVPPLVKLLDFRRPLTAQEKHGFYLRPQSIDEVYPAANALEEIGKSSLPAVLSAIENESTSPTARENAVFVWMIIFGYQPSKGVAVLKRDAEKASNDATKQRLLWAVSKALIWCGSADRAKCRKAAQSGDSP